MSVILEVLFVLLVTADTILTYKIIDSGKGKEIAFAKRYIDNKPLAISLTVILTSMLIGWLRFVGMTWMLIPCILRFGYICHKNWRILNASR